MIFLLVAASLVAGAPLVAAVLVSVASLREDAAKSLARHAPGLFTATARRLLRASIGDAGPVPRPLRVTWPLPGRRAFGRPQRTTRTVPVSVPPPRRLAEDDEAGRSPALATPKG
jgi:hypothetical protein